MNQQFIKAFPTTLYFIQGALSQDQITELRETITLTEEENTPVNPDVWECDALSTYPFNNKHLDKFVGEQFRKYITDYLDHEHNLLPRCNLNIISWHNKYHNKQFQESHNHIGPGIIACGVYILDQENDSTSRIQFLDPNKNVKNAAGISDIKETPTFEGNDLILFPPYLEHRVLHETKDAQRTTVSFNVSFKV
jgi:hypothetical protein